ncbi:MAG: beta-ketoacyl-ACP synthase 3 [Planctomycetota bacterium]|jgi:3-oxoacyl-[acyl-carrier-protein] synthase-3
MSGSFGFAGFGAFVPETVLTNADLEKIVDTTDEWIVRRTGIRERHILRKDETILGMAVSAARRALEDAGVAPEEINDVRVGVNTWMRFPSLATQLQAELGVGEASASDVSAGCAGFIYAVEAAYEAMYLEKERYGRDTTALVVGVDGLSHVTDWTDRSTCVLLGDGAGAVVMKQTDRGAVLATHTQADGRYGDMLWSDFVLGCQANGDPRQFTRDSHGPRAYLHMDGRKVYAVAVESMVRDVHRVIEKYNSASGESLTVDDIDYFYPHQANMRILESVAKRLKLTKDRVYTEGVERYGNTSTASIPLGYMDNRERFDLPGDRLEIDMAFGAGFASGAVLRRVSGPACPS